MNTVLAILLFVLKLLGGILLFLLALVLLVCLLPLGARIDYRPGLFTVDAVLGPVHKRFMTRRLGEKKAKPAKASPPPSPPSAAPGQAAGPAPAARPAAASRSAPPAAPAAETAPQAPGLADKLLAAVRRDPVVFIERVVTHVLFAGGRLLHGIRVTELLVWWPVHAEEAANTALLYGGLMSALNNALVRLGEQMTVRPEELWLEPDFTGELAPRRHIAATVTMRPITLVALAPRLLWRIWRDPAFAGVFPFTKAPQAETTETKAS